MVVGRAIGNGGWGRDPKKPLDTETATPGIVQSFVRDLYEWGKEDGNDEMRWINAQWGVSRTTETGEKNYNTATSAFWRVIRRVLIRVDRAACDDADHWASHLVWTDLYKLSAHGNPTGRLESGQRDGCIRTLKAELDEYAPSKVLFLTGLNWAEAFLDNIYHTASSWPLEPPLEAAGQIQLSNGATSAFVVTPHPQGKPETPIVERAVQAFDSIGARD